MLGTLERKQLILGDSKRRVKTGDHKPNYALTIGGEPYSEQLISCSAKFEADGMSGMDMVVGAPLEGLQDAEVVLSIGYGENLVPYFSGKLEEPDDDYRIPISRAIAYGPGKLMVEQRFGEQKRYQRETLQNFGMDLAFRAAFPGGRYEVVSGRNYILEDKAFTLETTLAEAENSVYEPSGYVVFDAPGGKRVAMPRPRPGAGSRMATIYGEDQYKARAFELKKGRRAFFSQVVVFRRGPSGANEIEAWRKVRNSSRFQPPKNRIYPIPEFPGSASAAEQEALDTADILSRGVGEWKLKVSPAYLSPHDTVGVERTERKGEERYRVLYACAIDDAVELSIAPGLFEMNLSGSAVKLSEEKVLDQPRISPGIAPLVGRTDPRARFTNWGQTDVLFADLGMPYAGLN